MSKSNGKGFIIGAAIGAALGLLFAPKKGEELRKDVKRSLKDYQRKAGDLSEKGKEVGEEVVRTVQDQVSKKKVVESLHAVSEAGQKIIEPVVGSFDSKTKTPEAKKKRVFKGIK